MIFDLKDRPDYSPREVALLRGAYDGTLKGTTWCTNETPPRPVEIKGQALVDPDVTVVQITGEDKASWLMSCGSTYDGSIVGTDIWLRETV